MFNSRQSPFGSFQIGYDVYERQETIIRENPNKNVSILKSLLDNDEKFGLQSATGYLTQNNINTVGKNGSFLHLLVRDNELELIRKIKKEFVTFLKINVRNNQDNTPLQCMLNGVDGFIFNPEIALELTQDYKAKDKNGNTLLHYLILGHYDIKYIKELLEKAPEILFIKNNDNLTAYELLLNGRSPDNLDSWEREVIIAALPIYKSLANKFLKDKKYDRALSTCTDAINICPTDEIQTYYFQEIHADICSAKQDYDQAINAYHYCLELAADSIYGKIRIHGKIGNIYLSIGNYDGAQKEFDKALDIDPHDGLTHYSHARAFIELKHYNMALLACESSLKFNPYNNISSAHQEHILKCTILRSEIFYLQNNTKDAFVGLSSVINADAISEIRNSALNLLFKLLTSPNISKDISNLKDISKKEIIELFKEFPKKEKLELLNMCQDPSTALGLRFMKSESNVLSIYNNENMPGIFKASPKKGSLQVIHEMIMEIKMEEMKLFNKQLSNNPKNIHDEKAIDGCWLQDEDPNAIQMQSPLKSYAKK